MRDKLARMMYGRNGMDELSRFLSVIAFIVIIIAIFTPETISVWLSPLALCLIIVAYIRMFSKNLYKRRAENARYIETRIRIGRFFRIKKEQFELRKEYRFFKCPGCKVTIRIPKGKGNIIITCPRCRTSFKGKS